MLRCDRCHERERGLLAALVEQPEWLTTLGPELRPEDWAPEHRAIFGAVLAAAREDGLLDPSRIESRLAGPDRALLHEILADAPARAAALDALRRRAGEQVARRAERTPTLAEALDDPRGEAAADWLSTGSEPLDDVLGGLRPGGLTIVASPDPGAATSFGLDLVSGVVTASLLQTRVLVVSTATSRREVTSRLLARLTSAAPRPSQVLSFAQSAAWDREAARALLGTVPVWILDGPGRAPEDVRSAAQEVVAQAVVVLDADLIAGPPSGLATLAGELVVPLVATLRTRSARVLQELGKRAGEADAVLRVRPWVDKDPDRARSRDLRVDVLWNRQGGQVSFVHRA